MREWKWGKRKRKGRWKKDLYREGGELSSQDEEMNDSRVFEHAFQSN